MHSIVIYYGRKEIDNYECYVLTIMSAMYWIASIVFF